MDANKLFGKYGRRLKREGMIKSALFGFIIGFALNLVFAVLSWLFFPGLFWIGFVILAVVTVAVAVFLYMKKYKPTDEMIARRIDREFDLRERMVTMNQFQGEDTFIAQKQREDANEQLEKHSGGKIKFAISAIVITITAVVAFFSLSATSLPVLAALDVIPKGMTAIQEIERNSHWYDVTYEIRSGEGELLGELHQRVRGGDSTSGVLAIPNVDWVFTYWEDGLKDPYRVDENVSANATHYAVFTESRLPDDLPPEPKEADDDPDKPPASPGNGSGNGGTMGSSEWEQPNFVYDGETNYAGKVYDMAYEEAMEWIAENPNISDAERDLIVGYFKTIEKKE